MISLVKSSLKLLFRTKGFWFFLILTPILSTIILKNKVDTSSAYLDRQSGEIIELANADEKVAYNGGNGQYIIKVYDAAGNDISEALLKKLADSGLYMICHVDMTDPDIIEKEERLSDINVFSGDGTFVRDFIDRHMKRDGYEDKMGSAIYLYPGFGEDLQDQISSKIRVYDLSGDERTEILEQDIEAYISRVTLYGKAYLDVIEENSTEKNVVSIAGGNGENLTAQQVNYKTHLGYAFAFMTLGFVFCGIFVAHTAIKEQKNGVYVRINLADTSIINYYLSKLITEIIVTIMSTGVMGICTLFIDEEEFGMNKGIFLLMIFLMGLIFSSLSMFFGILMGDIMGANVVAFSIWCLSALLSGLYFPLNETTDFIKILSSLMPQKWFLEGAEKIFVGDNNAVGMLICITVAYLAITLSLGGLGLKIVRKDEWGNS